MTGECRHKENPIDGNGCQQEPPLISPGGGNQIVLTRGFAEQDFAVHGKRERTNRRRKCKVQQHANHVAREQVARRRVVC
jgi:hypothetical protein